MLAIAPSALADPGESTTFLRLLGIVLALLFGGLAVFAGPQELRGRAFVGIGAIAPLQFAAAEHRSPVAQLAEHPAVNRRVVGSSPTRGVPKEPVNGAFRHLWAESPALDFCPTFARLTLRG